MADEPVTLRAATHPPATAAVEPISGFARNVSRLLETIEYRRCESGEDLEAIYQLRYKAYRLYGFVPRLANRMVSDEVDDAVNCYRYGVFIDNRLVSTLRLHHITPQEPFGPVMTVFDDILGPRLDRGETFVNPSQFAADPEWTNVHRTLPYVTLRLAVMSNEYFKSTSCVCMIRDEHTAFYRRIFGSEQVGAARVYQPISVPLMLFDSDCATNLARTIDRFPFFKSTPLEQRMMFARPPRGELSPLTVLPTAKYLLDTAA